MKVLVLIVVLTVQCAISAVAQKSIYTSTRTNSCRTITSTSEGTGSYVGECRGVAGYKVRIIEGDIRQTLDLITPGGKRFELNFWSIFSSFSSIGDRIEWRLKGNEPVGLIARYNVANPEDSLKNTSYLMVSRVGPVSACVTDVIAPGPGQNDKARAAADEAFTKPCKIKR
jgi:hypothetical protein